MPATQLSVTLPEDMAARVRAKVASGQYASESEVIRDGLHALDARDDRLEHFLRTEGVAAYDAMEADPSRARTLDQVRATLAAERKRADATRRG